MYGASVVTPTPQYKKINTFSENKDSDSSCCLIM